MPWIEHSDNSDREGGMSNLSVSERAALFEKIAIKLLDHPSCNRFEHEIDYDFWLILTEEIFEKLIEASAKIARGESLIDELDKNRKIKASEGER